MNIQLTGKKPGSAQHWVEEAAKRFSEAGLHFGHGTDNAWDEAAWLVRSAFGEPVGGQFFDWSRQLSADQLSRLEHMLRLRIDTCRPAAYITGTTLFAGLEFEVNEHVLVPRSPIAELIADQFSPWVRADRVDTALDLCTGSGCIAVAIAANLPRVRVDAADISEEALVVARRNVSRHALNARVRTIHSDLFQALAGRRYDLIVSNPPYVSKAEWRNLPPEYHAEPSLGLLSGSDGLDAVLQILYHAVGHLNPDGVLICEVGESEQRLVALLPEIPFMWLEFARGGSGVFVLGKQQLSDSAGHILRVLTGRRKGKSDVS